MSTATFDVQAVVGPDWIAARVDDPTVRIIEVDVSPAAFDAGHIPGAVFWNAYGDRRPVDYRPLPSSAFARLLAQSGIGPDTTVVFYGYGAYLGYWLMRSYGHSRVCLLGGPRERWVEDGFGWATEVPAPAPTRYPIAAGRSDVATQADVRGLIGDPDAVLVDVRSREEFAGERFWPSGGMQEGGRAGHVPGAVWLPIDISRQSPEEVRDVCEAGGGAARASGDRLLHDRQPRQPGLVPAEGTARVSARQRLLRLVGRVGDGSGDAGRRWPGRRMRGSGDPARGC